MKKKAIHMKFLNHSIGFCLLLTLLCYSCASDYLDTAPTNQVSPADLFKDEAYAAYAVSGLEKLMKTTYPTNKLDGADPQHAGDKNGSADANDPGVNAIPHIHRYRFANDGTIC